MTSVSAGCSRLRFTDFAVNYSGVNTATTTVKTRARIAVGAKTEPPHQLLLNKSRCNKLCRPGKYVEAHPGCSVQCDR